MEMSSNTPRKGLRRAVIDFLVVVFGILAAFGLDASWDRFIENREETRILLALQEEFSQNQSGVANAVRRHREFVEWADAFLAPRDSSTPTDSLVQYLARLSRGWVTFNSPNGTTEALLRGGRLPTLQDFELQRMLAAWPGSMADLAESEGRTIKAYDDLSLFVASESLFPINTRVVRNEFLEFEKEVLTDPRIANLIIRRRIEEGEALTDSERVAAEIDSILERIQRLVR